MTLTSILIAIGVTTLGYAIARTRDRRPAASHRFLVDRRDARAAAGGAVIGSGIGFMHYTGMSAVIVPGAFTWDMRYVAASVLVGCVFSAAAMVANRRLNAKWAFWIAPGLLTLAICSLHFTAMAAATVIPDSTIIVQPSVINTLGMALAVAGSTILIMLATVGSALVNSQVERDQHLQLLEAQRLGKIGDWRYMFGSEIWVGPQVYNLLGYKPLAARPSRKAVLSVYRGDGARRVIEAQAEVARSREVKTVDVKFRRGDGSVGDFAVTTKALMNSVGEVIGFAGTIQDISERKSAEEQLAKLAYYDPLTGLANRALFHRELESAFNRSQRTGAAGALLLVDLDRFKEVNDSLGHLAGDELLMKVAHIIAGVLDKGHVLARIGGDEFAIVIPACSNQAAVAQLAEQVIGALSQPILLERGEVSIGASIGVALLPRDGTSSGDLLRNADLALHRAKEDGRGRHTVFHPDMNTVVQYKIGLERDLRSAVSTNSGLSVHYQPQVELATGRVIGFEALLRWTHPARGNVPPAEFIPIAERSSLICDLGSWLMREAATQAKAWLDAGEPSREIAVNVSAAQVWHADLVGEVARILTETGVPPHLLCLELTESLMADHSEGRVRTVLKALKQLGVTLALDDFGTDYSSLGYLVQLPFDKLKIDRIFVSGATESDRSRELLKGIIGLGLGLGMTVYGEGAETSEEVAILREFGCDFVQGYAFAHPTAAAEALAFARGCEGKLAGLRSAAA